MNPKVCAVCNRFFGCKDRDRLTNCFCYDFKYEKLKGEKPQYWGFKHPKLYSLFALINKYGDILELSLFFLSIIIVLWGIGFNNELVLFIGFCMLAAVAVMFSTIWIVLGCKYIRNEFVDCKNRMKED